MIPLCIPHLKGNEWKYTQECLDTNWICEGRFIKLFEEKIANYIGVNHAIACSNCTAALHLSLVLMGVKQGDEVIVPTITFIAPINTVTYVGAHPVFMDCDNNYNLDVNKSKEFLENECEIVNGNTINKKSKRIIKAIMPVHAFGTPVDMDPLNQLAKEYNLKVIEDSSESLGSLYKNRKTCGLSDISCLSFNGNKIVTTGGGGMILTNNKEAADKAANLMAQAKDKSDPFNYIHNEIGYNYRLNNIQAAIGLAQFEKIDEFLKTKEKNFNLYRENLKDSEVELSLPPAFAKPNHWYYALRFKSKEVRDKIIEEANKQKIQIRPIWYPNHLQKPHLKHQNYKIINAIKLQETSINLPCSIGITKEEINQVCEVIKNNT